MYTVKDIEGYEGLYQITSTGVVISRPKGNGNGNKYRVLRPDFMRRNHTNYHRVSLSKEGVVTRIQVHRLVAQAFIPNPDKKEHVNHIDNNGENNNVNNLEWCTHSENMEHSTKQGRQDVPRKLGGATTAKLRGDACLSKLAGVLGERFIASELRKVGERTRRFVSLRCICGEKVTVRTSSVVIGRGGICNVCAKGEDIVSAAR